MKFCHSRLIVVMNVNEAESQLRNNNDTRIMSCVNYSACVRANRLSAGMI